MRVKKRMKDLQFVVALSLSAVIVTMLAIPAVAYTIDGCMDDWGVNLSEDWSVEDTWVPSSPTTYWSVEDNIDCSQYYSSAKYCGVHITGIGTSYTRCAEPKVIMWKKGWLPHSYKQPYHERRWSARSRELNDIEAMYSDTNATHAFIAIVTSIPLDTVMGDLAIDLDNDPNTGNRGYEYGIVLNGADKGNVYKNPGWSDTDRFKGSGPYRVTNGTVVGTANVKYVDQDIFDFGYTNWVIEISVPKSVFGNFDRFGKLHTTLYCGNDLVEINHCHAPTPPPTSTPPLSEEIPEFSTIAIPLGVTLALFYYFRRRKTIGKRE